MHPPRDHPIFASAMLRLLLEQEKSLSPPAIRLARAGVFGPRTRNAALLDFRCSERSEGYAPDVRPCPASFGDAAVRRSSFVRRRSYRDSRDYQLVEQPTDAGGKGAGSSSAKRPLGLVETPRSGGDAEPPDTARHAGVQPMRRALRAWPSPHVERFGLSQARSRAASAISASARMHLARAPCLLLGPKARDSTTRREPLRSNKIAELRHSRPCCGASKCRPARRRAGRPRFNAPSGSPAASARAAALVIQRVHQNPAILVTPIFSMLRR